MQKISENITFIAGQDKFLPDSHLYVIGKKESRDLTLIDAGLMGADAYKLRSIEEGGYRLEDIKRVIMTHTHLDHIGCLHEIMKKLPGIELWVHSEEALPLEQGDEKTVYGMEAFRTMFQAQFNLMPGYFSFEVNRKLQGGEILSIGGTDWEILHIPGHSRGSIALYDHDDKVLISGDVVYADFAIGRFDLYGANAIMLKKSLFRLAELDVKILLPGHNRILMDVKPDYIRKTAEQWEDYLN